MTKQMQDFINDTIAYGDQFKNGLISWEVYQQAIMDILNAVIGLPV